MNVDDPDMARADSGLYGSGLSRTVEKLMSGEVFTALSVDLTQQRAAALEAVLAEFVDGSTRVAWVGNPLRSPLTIERFLLQIVGPMVDLRIERGPAELARLIAQREGVETRLLVVVQQPETIDPQTLDQLGALAGHLGEEAIQVQFLFVGSSALRLPKVAGADLPPILPRPARIEAPAEQPVKATSKRWHAIPLIALLLLSGLGAVTLHAFPHQNLSDLEGLRQKFSFFLDDRAPMPLTAAQKNALFDEFLARSRSN